jgi:glycerophosphoryl diester phosphodiesterase
MKRALIAAALALAACDRQPCCPMDVVPTERPPSLDLPEFFDCLRGRDQTMISAHRGGPTDGFAENAIPTFANTLQNALVFLEVDVARTRDGVLVLMHDDDVVRTTNGRGAVSSLTAEQFAALRLRDKDGDVLDAHPPTLREALDWAAPQTVLELDVKRGVSYEDVAHEVRRADAMHRVVFITYSVDGAARLSRVAPEALIYTTITSVRDLDALERRGVDLSHIVAWLGTDPFDEELVKALAVRGVESRGGMFESGDDFAGAAHFAEAAHGMQSLAVDDVEEAFRQVDRDDSVDGYGVLECVSTR